MKRTCGRIFLIVSCCLLVPAITIAGGNIPPSVSAQAVAPSSHSATATSSDFITSGTQIISDDDSCQSVTVTIAGYLTGTEDDGYGLDIVTFDLWDDGELKDSADVSVPVGETHSFNVTLGFSGRYLSGAPGVGVLANEVGYSLDPFYPEDIQGTCSVEAIKCWISPPTIVAGESVTVFAEIPSGASKVWAFQGDIKKANMTDEDGDSIFSGSFIWPKNGARSGWMKQFTVRAITPEGEVWCPGVKIVKSK